MPVDVIAHPYGAVETSQDGSGTGWKRLCAVLVAGLLVFIAAEWFATGSALYRTHAIVGVPAGGEGLEEAAVLALTRPVLARASTALHGQGYSALEDRGGASSEGEDFGLERELAANVAAVPDHGLNALTIEASAESNARAALAANAVATALIDVQNEAGAERRRMQDTESASRLEALSSGATEARQRLDSLQAAGDGSQDRLKAAALTARAKTHFEAFKFMLASGSPPVGAQTGLPASIAPLQANYLELKSRAGQASRNGATVPRGLEDAVTKSGRLLQAEWERLTRVAQSDYERARDGEAGLTQKTNGASPGGRSEVDSARLAARVATEALEQFRTRIQAAASIRPYRLIEPARTSEQSPGLSGLLRHVFAGLAAIAAAGIALRASAGFDHGRGRQQARDLAEDWEEPVAFSPLAGLEPRASRAVSQPAYVRDDHLTPRRRRDQGPVPEPAFVPEPVAAGLEVPFPAPVSAPVVPASGRPHVSIPDLAERLDGLETHPGCPLTIFIGTLSETALSAPVALRLARAAAAAGRRVLLIEGGRPHSFLADAVSDEAMPVVVDVLGMLKAAMPDRIADGLYIAPALPGGARLASNLARAGTVPFVGNAAEEFDVAIIDGGHVDAATPKEWGAAANATIRVGRFMSQGEDEAFLSAIGGSPYGYLGPLRPGRSAAPQGKGGPVLAVDNTHRSRAPHGPRYASAS